MTGEKPYVLGTGDDELERLGLQHQLWSDAAHAAFRQAGIAVGHRVLDVGCGPGYAAFDLAQMVTRRGHVLATDESAPFLDHLSQQAISRGLPQLACKVGDVQDLDAVTAGEAPFDLAYARWVLCFVKQPEAVVQGIGRALRPGGRVIVQDYFNYRSMTLAPRLLSHDRAVEATITSWHQRGGNPDVGELLPAMLDEAGFEIEHLQAHQRTARGTDSMYAWVDVWWHTFGPKLVEMGLFAQADCDELLQTMVARRTDPRAFIHCPPVYEIIARKR